MGTQQLLLIIIGIIITAVGIAVGVQLFGGSSVLSNRDALVNDINNIAANAAQYRSRLSAMGGGGGSFVGYIIPDKLQENDDGSFTTTNSPGTCMVTATSALGFGTVSATIDSVGKVGVWTYTGEFQ